MAKTAIVHLYEYAVEDGLIEQVPFKYRKSRAHFGFGNETDDLGVKTSAREINFIDIRRYLNDWKPHLLRGRNVQRNIAYTELLITTGLRISEAQSLEVHQIPDPEDSVYAGKRSVTIQVVGKGNKKRKIRIPKRVVRLIRFYIEEDRQATINLMKKIGDLTTVPTKVFLSSRGNPWAVRTIEKLFKSISKPCAIRLTPHGCRHTFAIYQLEAMIKRMAINLREIKASGADAYRQILNDPLRQLQLMLGHAWIQTVYTYLDFLEEAEAQVEDSLDAWTNWGNSNG